MGLVLDCQGLPGDRRVPEKIATNDTNAAGKPSGVAEGAVTAPLNPDASGWLVIGIKGKGFLHGKLLDPYFSTDKRLSFDQRIYRRHD